MAKRSLSALESALEELRHQKEAEITAIAERLEVATDWQLFRVTVPVEWLGDARYGMKLDRMRIKANAAKVHLGKLRRELDDIAKAMGVASE